MFGYSSLIEDSGDLESLLIDLELRMAVHDGDEFETLRLLRKGANPNKTYQEGCSSLHIAVIKGQSRLIKHLINYGADIEKTDKVHGYKPIHFIIKTENKIECLEELIKHNVYLNSRDSSGNTLLQLTVKWNPNKADFVKKLISLGMDANTVNNQGNNCMHDLSSNAVRQDEKTIKMAELLIKKGINLNHHNFISFETPLHTAARFGKSFLVDVLLREGAAIDAVDKNGIIAIHKLKNSGIEVYRPFIKHYVLKIHRGENVKQYLIRRIKSDAELKRFYDYFVADLEHLKLEAIICGVSYYDILCGKNGKVENYMRNADIRDKVSGFTHISTKYNKEIHHKIEKVKEIIKNKEIVFNVVNEIIGERLPNLCVEIVARCLNLEDVKRFVMK